MPLQHFTAEMYHVYLENSFYSITTATVAVPFHHIWLVMKIN